MGGVKVSVVVRDGEQGACFRTEVAVMVQGWFEDRLSTDGVGPIAICWGVMVLGQEHLHRHVQGQV